MILTDAMAMFIALFLVIDPIALAPLFLALTAGASTRERRSIAIRAVLTGFGVLFAFSLVGNELLEFLGISLPAFRIAGGLLLFLTALDMLFERRTKRRQDQADETPDEDDPSVFPLAIPLIAGPGAIATMILLTGEGGIAQLAMVNLVMVSVLLVVMVLFLLATPLERLLGPVGINVTTRLLGMLLAALAVQFVVDGVRALALF